jgi:ParB-like chromosome segregation protein Spo0J
MQAATEIEFHEACLLFQEMAGAELDELAQDIRDNGLREAIWTHDGKIIDGRNRLNACEIAGVKPTFREWKGKGSLVKFVYSLNYHRRHLNLTPSQKAILAVDAKRLIQSEIETERPKKISATTKGKPKTSSKLTTSFAGKSRDSRKEAAALIGVSPAYITAAEKIAEKSPETADEVKSGKKTITQAKQELGLTPPKPKGQCRLNGVLVDDPPDIAKQRSQGKIPPGVIPEIEEKEEPTKTEDVKEEFEERAAMGDEALSDEAWLAALPARPSLSGAQLAMFDEDALLFRKLKPHRAKFKHNADIIFKKLKRKGAFYWKTIGFLKTAHPSEWIVCPPTNYGGCGGKGSLSLLGDCPMCKTRGYRINA